MSKLLEAHERGEYLPARMSEASLPSAAGDTNDPFLAHGMGGQSNYIIGKILKVPAGQNGEYSVKGEGDGDDMVIPRGTEMLVAIDKLVLCWTRWDGGKPAERIAGYIADGFKAQARESLGFLDEETWEKDEFGKGRDPWKLENLLPMKDLRSGALYTAFISGKGSPDDGVRYLTLSYGRTDRTKYPVVKLGRDFFVSKRNGHRSWYPTLPVTGRWLPKAEFAKLETSQTAGTRQERRDYQAPLHSGADDPGLPDYIDAGPEDRIDF